MEYKREELQSMKRADLQKLCKKFGVKANMKTEKLVEELITKYSNTKENDLIPAIPSTNEVAPVQETSEEVLDDVEKVKTKETKTSKKRKLSGNKMKKPVKSSKIPRLNQLKIEGKKIEIKTPTSITNEKTKTPKRTEPKDWSKIHQKQFEKMDSLDVYLTKKQERAEKLGTSGKNVKVLTEGKANTTKNKSVQRKTLEPVAKPKPVATPKFNEIIKKQKRLTFNFAAKENGGAETPGGTGRRRATINETHKPATPFRFTSNTMPFGSPTPRMKFNLKASLSKPLKYKPYTGKVPTPPYAKHTAKPASVKKTAAQPTHQRDVKAVKTRSRNDRRERQTKIQSKARESAVSRRRGLMN